MLLSQKIVCYLICYFLCFSSRNIMYLNTESIFLSQVFCPLFSSVSMLKCSLLLSSLSALLLVRHRMSSTGTHSLSSSALVFCSVVVMWLFYFPQLSSVHYILFFCSNSKGSKNCCPLLPVRNFTFISPLRYIVGWHMFFLFSVMSC